MIWSHEYEGDFDLEVYQQYQNTNIEKLLKGIQRIRNTYIEQTIKSFIEEIYDIRTARGIGLDVWGKILNFSRFLPIPGPKDPVPQVPNVKEFTFHDTNFIKLQFQDRDKADYLRMDDFSYRIILMMLMQKQNVFPNLIEVSDLNREIFKQVGVSLIVLDSEKMENLTLLADTFLPPWLEFVIRNYDIILRPLCLGTEIKVDLRKPINFYLSGAEDPDKASESITNFYYGNFEK